MTNLNQKLKDLIHKSKHGCGECGGKKYRQKYDRYGEYIGGTECKNCQGKGFVIPLEKGCEVEYTRFGKTFETVIDNYWVLRKEENCIIEYTEEEHPKTLKYKITKNLGKPIEGTDILNVLNKIVGIKMSINNFGVLVKLHTWKDYRTTDKYITFQIPLDKKPQEYSDKTIKSLIEILS